MSSKDHVAYSWTLDRFPSSYVWYYTEQILTHTILIATSLKPFSSKRWIILPTRPRCTPSGLTMMKVRSLFSAIINLQIICSKVEMEQTTMRCRLAAINWERDDGKPRREIWRKWGLVTCRFVNRTRRPVESSYLKFQDAGLIRIVYDHKSKDPSEPQIF